MNMDEIYRAALIGLTSRKAYIDCQIEVVRAELAGKITNPTVVVTNRTMRPARRIMTAEGRSRISAATKKRWQEYRRGKKQGR